MDPPHILRGTKLSIPRRGAAILNRLEEKGGKLKQRQHNSLGAFIAFEDVTKLEEHDQALRNNISALYL